MGRNGSLAALVQGTGLDDKAAKIYAYLLEAGGAFPSGIAEATGVNRSTTYKILTSLSIQGIVSEVERGKKLFYSAESPEKLARVAARKADTARSQSEHARSLLPDLLELYTASGSRPRIRYYEGHDDVLKIYEDHVQQTKPYEMLAIANSDDVLSYLPESFYKKYRKAKAQSRISTRGILPSSQVSEKIVKDLYGDIPKRLRPIVRYLAPEKFPLAGEVVIYRDDRVSLVQLTKQHISGTIIEDKGFNTMMRSIFELAWAGAKEK
jgi:sugar-specific transcriptional regulator TrmB